MINVKAMVAGTVLAGAFGAAALGIGSGVANAAPTAIASGAGWAQYGGWGHGPGWGGPGWAPPPPPPPPPPYYGYGGYYPPGGCVSGPLGLLHYCT